MADDETTPQEESLEEAEAAAAVPAPASVVDPAHEPLLARLRGALGDGIVDAASTHGTLVVRVRNEDWRRAAQVAREHLDCTYLSFISGIDWMPRPMPPTEDPNAPSFPAQPQEMTFGVTGSEGRFQVFACVVSPEKKHQVVFKTDVDEHDPRVASWTPVYAGADWHERECWEMFGVVFEGHPHLRHLYLPSEFEGHPLRKDFPLLSREVKPWPGLVDVELMPEGEEAEAEGEDRADAAAEGERAGVAEGGGGGGEAG